MPSDFVKKTPTIRAKILAVVAFNKTVPNTTMKTNGVMYSAPGSPLAKSFEPNNEAIPAATIPLGPTQPTNNFSLVFKSEPQELIKTPKGRIRKTITRKSATVFQL